VSASRVGCDEAEITTSNVRTVGVPIRMNWEATCKGQTFVCSRPGPSFAPSALVTCAPKI
jgi:hypothetical protein